MKRWLLRRRAKALLRRMKWIGSHTEEMQQALAPIFRSGDHDAWIDGWELQTAVENADLVLDDFTCYYAEVFPKNPDKSDQRFGEQTDHHLMKAEEILKEMQDLVKEK